VQFGATWPEWAIEKARIFTPIAQWPVTRVKANTLERFSNYRGVSKVVQGGFFLRKRPLEADGFPIHQLENRYSRGKDHE